MYSLKQLLISVLIAAIVFTTIGFFGANLVKQVPGISGRGADNLQPGLEEAYDRMIRRGHASIVARGFGFRESNVIAGEVSNITDDLIVLAVSPVNPLADPNLDVRNVKITEETKFYKLVEKTPEQVAADNEEYIKLMEQEPAEGATQPPLPPDYLTKQAIEKSEIEMGSLIEVIAANNIHNVEAFVALEVVLK